MYQRLSLLAAATIALSPLGAECWEPFGNRSFLEGCATGCHAELDYLLWYANLGGSSPSVNLKASGTAVPYVDPTFKQKDNVLRNKWNSGVRAILGYKPFQKSWDLTASYSYFSAKEKQSIGPLDTEFIVSDFVIESQTGSLILGNYYVNEEIVYPVNTLAVSSIGSQYKINFNQLDIEFGKEVLFSEDVTFSPFFGTRAIWVNQSLRSVQLNSWSGGVTFGDNETIIFNPQTGFNGFGARAGFDFSLRCYWNLKFYGTVSGGALWGRAKVKQKYYQTAISKDGDPALTTNFSVNHAHQRSVLNLDFALGLRWIQEFYQGRRLLQMQFGWEQHVYTNMNNIQNFGIQVFFGEPLDTNIARGNLSLSGFVFGLSYLY